ncbi:MAG: radical SAM protein, partial [Nitrososphaera sp.]|nr:radical SAM protein [Nitrososphaera sp.]
MKLVIPDGLYIAFLEGEYYIAFNSLASNGQVVVLDSTAYSILQLFQPGSTVDEAVRQACEKSFEQVAIQSTIQELHELEVLVSDGWEPANQGDSADILVAWLHITNECNLRCTYCYLNKTEDHMTADVGRKAVDAIFRSARIHNFKGVKIKFAGGEATLNFGLVIQLYDYAEVLARQSNLHLEGVILSNGVGITQQMAEAILQRGIRVMISLDGLAQYNDVQRVFINGKGSFAIVSRTIDRLLSQGLIPEISVTITDRNIDGLPEMLRYILKRNMPFSLNFYRENDCSSTFEELQYSDERMIDGMEAAYRVIEEFLPKRSLLGAIVDRANFN